MKHLAGLATLAGPDLHNPSAKTIEECPACRILSFHQSQDERIASLERELTTWKDAYKTIRREYEHVCGELRKHQR